MTRIRMGLLPGLLLALALALAACGGGDKGGGVASPGGDKATPTTSPSGGSGRMQQALAYARCMRQHGVNVPDPKISGNDIT
jgi:ABC-type glycerol-3-phosphate transport system substrate-binding protein